ncbi:hypothetical protein Tco_0394179 [Tanacetum coccineum]
MSIPFAGSFHSEIIGIMVMEPVIENMTLNEYLEYKAAKERRFRKSIAPVRNRVLVYPNPEDFEEILDDLFGIGGENLRSMEHEEVPNRCDDETDEENIDISIVKEKEEVPMEDVELAKDHDVDQPNDQSNFVQQITLSSISDEDAVAKKWKLLYLLDPTLDRSLLPVKGGD